MSFEREELARELELGIDRLGFVISEEQHQTLLLFLEMLVKWNKAYNLTSVRDPKQMLQKHILDSLSVMPFVRGKRVIDVGTGPGLPGIPLAIVLPHIEFSLLDSLGKRVRFMKQVAHECKLGNIHPIQSRVEAHQPELLYDIVISRAFASLKDMLHWCQHLVDFEGRFLALKGQYPQQEIDEVSDYYHIEAVTEISVPDLIGERHLVTIKKK
ncbi:16S rRNA (guanine(527)-N(7))-methyltransferase RsmG [Alteromonas sp. ASW11-130]|uniref:16S rRNA (guanine(527)-N(7))-methyltransferase RsmG n=1 Tax=Alteromonas sp. ASW11-130 TaxID=3015775 RepID=UPI002242BE8F|nr:16S rRNA (guanine(527)-N(7))-methyltransferase RsmG [Alteromonas sp. ASW11-130]MCW8093422.1 16S rRNA (guanine(527)-N(7))-methyltransferase RsmG [Alteromonas sp. ASW11-130]